MATLKTIMDHVMDICENAARARSSLCELYIEETKTTFKFKVADYGIGMSEEVLNNILDPFFTTKKERTKKFGMGLPFLKFSSELTGGYFSIQSSEGKGTTVEVLFNKDNIDCQPVGDAASSIFSIVYINNNVDWYINRTINDDGYELDTRTFKEEYGDDFFSVAFMGNLKDIIFTLEEELKNNQEV